MLLVQFLLLSSLLFCIGIYGVLARKNGVMVLMSIELILNAVNINFVAFGTMTNNIAGEVYDNARLWWIIAAASGIGWAPQAPPGTFLIIPTDLGQISGMV